MEPQKLEAIGYQRARFTAQLPVAYLYTDSHFWIGREGGDTWRIGLTRFGSRMLGEMVDYGFELSVGAPVIAGQVVGWIEGFKAISELSCVAEGSFAGSNPALEQRITLVNQDPHGTGWLYAVKGTPANTCVQVHEYVKILDRTIDLLQTP